MSGPLSNRLYKFDALNRKERDASDLKAYLIVAAGIVSGLALIVLGIARCSP